jgi:3D (Asp-Asp-Asp) domain-containing protein
VTSRLVHGLAVLSLGFAGCSTSGSAWMAEPLPGEGSWPESEESRPASGRPHANLEEPEPAPAAKVVGPTSSPGRTLGKFRNTYYDFPSEGDFDGEPVALKDARCRTISDVPRGFYESVCVQGSGTLKSGETVSFAKRDCECASLCPRSGQKICFDSLSARDFPWGRGAMGQPITPLLTLAVDSDQIPLGTAVYIPEYDGLPRDPDESATHDGCFVAQDRGLKVEGQHVDVFTGHRSITELWNRLVPSNQGVTVIVDNPKCERAER